MDFRNTSITMLSEELITKRDVAISVYNTAASASITRPRRGRLDSLVGLAFHQQKVY